MIFSCQDICKSRKRREVDLVSASNYPDGFKVYGGPFLFGDEFECKFQFLFHR